MRAIRTLRTYEEDVASGARGSIRMQATVPGGG
jgi:hypothetical protein